MIHYAPHFYYVLEVPFIITATVMSFIITRRFKGRPFGLAMLFLAWSFLVMGIGHILLLLNSFGYAILEEILGDAVADLSILLALISTWLLAIISFSLILKADRFK